jgi:hypothetical protein
MMAKAKLTYSRMILQKIWLVTLFK